MDNSDAAETPPSAQLLPCPFCGHTEAGTHYDARLMTQRHWVSCDDCVSTSKYSDSEAEAIKAWNTRAPDPLLAEAITCLNDLVKDLEIRAQMAVAAGEEDESIVACGSGVYIKARAILSKHNGGAR